MRKIKVIDRAEEFPQIKGLWEELASCARETRAGTPFDFAQGRSASTQTIFQSHAWNEIAARIFAERERPYVVVAESDSGAAIIPACVRMDAVSLLGEELFDYRDVIADGDEAVLDAAWRKLHELQKPVEVKAVRGERDWAEMRPFAGAPYLPASVLMERNKSLERNLRLLGERGCALEAQGLKPRPFLATDHPAEAGCPRENATGMARDEEQRRDGDGIGGLPRRQARGQDNKSSSGGRLAALAEALPLDCASPAATAPLGVTNGKMPLEVESKGVLPPRQARGQDDSSEEQIPRFARNDKSTVDDIVRRMYVLKARQERGSLFRDRLRIAAVVEMAASAPTEVFTIEKEGELVAAALTFLDGHVCRFYGTYFDQRWARYSPGVSLLYRVIQQAQARGLDFDLMTGEQEYKMRFASGVVPLYIAQVPMVGRIAA